jgi:transposase
MRKGKRYTQEFKVEAVKQITERSYSVAEVSDQLDICTKTLYHWRSQLSEKPKQIKSSDEQLSECPFSFYFFYKCLGKGV